MRHWRASTWALIAWSALMVAWLVATAAGDSGANCASERTRDLREACEAGEAVGTGLGVAFILFIWFLGFVILALVWMMRRHARRDRVSSSMSARAER
jgi:Mn2+/Fe2+ NRAMP family transporter